MSKYPHVLCEECGDVFGCEHQLQRARIGCMIKEMFDRQDEIDRIEQEQFDKYGYILPDDRDITGSD
jgi:hypothetical protein